MRKLIFLICVLAILLTCVGPVFAAYDFSAYVEPRYSLINALRPTAHVTTSGAVTLNIYCDVSEEASSVTCTYWLEFKEDDGNFHRCSSFYMGSGEAEFTIINTRITLTEHGEYRVVAELRVVGASGATDIDTKWQEFTY